MRDLPGLESGEQLRAAARASFRGSTATSGRGAVAPGGARARAQAFDAWANAAEAAGFPTAGPDMVLGVTDTRLVVWRTSMLRGRPIEITNAMPLHRIAQVSAVRHGIVVGVAFVVGGAIIEVEAVRGGPLRRLAREVEAAIAERRQG
jgi:hypothetical protein